MNPKRCSTRRPACRGRGGFTLTELLVTSSVTVLALSGVLACFIWCGRQASLCTKIAWSQKESMLSSMRLTQYIRNAAEIVAIDEAGGDWVELAFPDGTSGKLLYRDSLNAIRDGRMVLQRGDQSETIVARGLTKILDSGGYNLPVFRRTRANTLRVAYRVSEPAGIGRQIANDACYAASIRFAVALRNAGEVAE